MLLTTVRYHELFDKSNFAIFSRSPNYYSWITEIALPKRIVKRSSSVKYLGIIIDENLSFKYHVKAISRILSQNLGIIRKLKHFFPSNVLRLLYFSLIHPYILYWSSIWLGTFPSILHPIRMLQNNAIRSFCRIGSRDSVRSMYSIINIMPAAGLRDFYTLILCFTGICRERSNVHCHGTRTSGDIEVPRLVASRTAFSIIYRGAKLWNKLVPGTKELPISHLNLSCVWGGFKLDNHCLLLFFLCFGIMILCCFIE